MKRSPIAISALAAALLDVAPCFAEEPSEAPPAANADEVARCVSAHETAHLSMLGDRWKAARDALALCTDPVCPLAIRGDCLNWRDDLSKLLPTLLVVVERDRASSAPATFELDGQPIELKDENPPIQTEPGAHHLRFTLSPYSPIEQEVTLSKGEQNHLVQVRFSEPEGTAPEPPRPRPMPLSSRPITWQTITLGGAALAAFATSTTLLVSALTKRSQALDTCAPGCPSSLRKAVESRLLFADITGSAGAILGGFAVYSYVKRPAIRERGLLALPNVALDRHDLQFVFEGNF
jgi:hypothetical protein